MNILYTSRSVPVLEVDGVLYDFNRHNMSIIIGELSTDIDACNEIQQKVTDQINLTISSTNISVDSDPMSIHYYISTLADLGEFYIVEEILSQAINNHKMLTTPKPHDKWVWNSELSDWVPPIDYPSIVGDGVYLWSDDLNSWEPAEPKPHSSWIWDEDNLTYRPPVPYPIDAEPGEFVWSEEKLIWVIND